MPREIITVQVGQCGNQIGCRFWELALREHAAHNPRGTYDAAMSSFFRNVDARFEPPLNLPVGDGTGSIRALKARAVIVDTEEGVVGKMLRGPLADVFDARQLVHDVSGAGNNWAHGHHGYGPQYRDAIAERVRAAAEACDALQSFVLLHSLGGGTGSGLGTYILGMLEDEYPGAARISSPILPSADDHVVTAPYNAALATAELLARATAVLPMENQALLDAVARAERSVGGGGGGVSAGAGSGGGGGKQASGGAAAASAAASKGGGGGGATGNAPWDAVNGLAAGALLGLTAGVRFGGALNLDLGDLATNLVPYPRLKLLLASYAPLAAPRDVGALAGARGLDRLFADVFSREHQLLWAEPRAHTFLGTALLLRGAGVGAGDAQRNVARLRAPGSGLRLAHWNEQGFKVALCGTPPVGLPYSLLAVSNNCCVVDTLRETRARFRKLYGRRLFLHHYEQYMGRADFDAADEELATVEAEYAAADAARPPMRAARLRPRGVSFCA